MSHFFSESELWGLVNRADSHEKIQIAANFIAKLDYINVDTFNELMDALAFLSRELYHNGRS